MRNVTWTGLTWGEYEKISPENFLYKTVVVLDSDKENEDKRLINVNRPNMQRERIVEVLNVNNDPWTLIKHLGSGLLHKVHFIKKSIIQRSRVSTSCIQNSILLNRVLEGLTE